MTSARVFVCAVLAVALVARADDVSGELLGSYSGKSENNPRSGSFGAAANGSVDIGDEWSVFGGLTYLRELPTRTADTRSFGANVFLINAGALFMPNEHVMVMASANLAPPVEQANATTVSFGPRRESVDLTVRSRTTSGGVNVVASYFTSAFGDVEHTFDVLAGFTAYSAFQQLEVPDTTAGARLRAYCALSFNDQRSVCPLVNGAETPLVQVRFSASYTATLFKKLDVGVDAAGYVYTADPNTVGFYSVVQFGRLPDFGSGVPVLPLLATGRVFGAYRFERLSLRLSYQYGHYTGGLGANHVVSGRLAFRFSKSFKLTLIVSGQADVFDGAVLNPGVFSSLGGLYTF